MRYYSFMVNLDKCIGICNTLNDHPAGYMFQKTDDANLKDFNLKTRINELKTLAKHISCECKCIIDSRKYSSNQKWNNDKCPCECENLRKHHVSQKDYIWNTSTCTCKNNEIVPLKKSIPTKTVSTKTVLTTFNVEKVTYKIENFYVLLIFLLIIISL